MTPPVFKNLVTPEEVVALAYAADEHMPASAVAEADIAAAEMRSIMPVMGRALYEAVAAGAYPELREGYAAPAAAMYVRLAMQPLSDVRTGRFGAMAPRSSGYEPAERAKLLDLRRALRAKARTLLHRLHLHLEECASQYPEYDPASDILNRCTTDGGFVQIH